MYNRCNFTLVIGDRNLGTFHYRKLKFGMILTQTDIFYPMIELPLGLVQGRSWGSQRQTNLCTLDTRLVCSSFQKAISHHPVIQKPIIFGP